MANTTTSKSTKATAKPAVEQTVDAEQKPIATAKKKKSTVRKRIELDPNSIVTVKNGFQGELIYKSKKTGEKFDWESFGDEQDIELPELKSAKNSCKAFFINNWFLIDDPDVIDYLGVNQYYDNALSYDEFDSIFEMKPSEIEDKISKLSEGQKQSVIYRARRLIADGGIDSNKVISTLEKCLSTELIDR